MIFYTLYITPLALQVLSSETLSELGQEQALATRLRVVRELQGQVDITVCSVHSGQHSVHLFGAQMYSVHLHTSHYMYLL